MIQQSQHEIAPDSTDEQVDSAPLRAEPTPPWVMLLVGFFFLDGLFGAVAISLRLPAQPLYMIPPFSFLWWYAYEDPWGWVQDSFGGALVDNNGGIVATDGYERI